MAQIRLDFEPSNAGTGSTSFPVAFVCLTERHIAESRAAIRLSAACVSVQELEAAVRSLHRQLDSVLAEGRQRFAEM